VLDEVVDERVVVVDDEDALHGDRRLLPAIVIVRRVPVTPAPGRARIIAAMAKPTKRKVEGGRVTPKGGHPRGSGHAPAASTRYTPPSLRKDQMPSPRWVPV